MTVKQYRKKVEIARKYGHTTIDDTAILYYHGSDWSLENKNGNTIDVSYDPKDFEYICD